MNDDESILFPVGRADRGIQTDVRTLLPRDLYRSLTKIIEEAVPRSSTSRDEKEFEEHRTHRACLIQGARGVGKSTILLNLQLYLEHSAPELAKHVHVLKPVDPTQLEESEDLFLNMIVAGLLTDDQIEEGGKVRPEKKARLYDALQDVGRNLEARQTHRSNIGIDKLRAFMGSKRLAYSVHRLFEAALGILDKKLLVLPIDDVDTTLHRAFENLEVVRRYLSSSFVLPVVCGDLGLYREVIRRDFVSRLLNDDQRDRVGVSVRGNELAVEYDRKVLPLQYRLEVPTISEYLANQRISIQISGYELPLPDFVHWIRALLMGPVNGLENSHIVLPIHTVRALGQLLEEVKDELPALMHIVRDEELSGLGVRRGLLMAVDVAKAIGVFEGVQQRGRASERRDSRSGYRAFRNMVTLRKIEDRSAPLAEIANRWRTPLLEHFQYEPTAGGACLVLSASLFWRQISLSPEDLESRGPLAHELFQPQAQKGVFDLADRPANLQSWRSALEKRLPDEALQRLPATAILPFPPPEAGRAISTRSQISFHEREIGDPVERDRLNLVNKLITHRGYYSVNKRAPLILSGRLLELLIMSFLRSVTVNDIFRLLANPPFHSAAAVAPTKTMYVSEESSESLEEEFQQTSSEELEESIESLVQEINVWRVRVSVESADLSPWLAYNALNKTLNQVWLFNPPLPVRVAPEQASAIDLAHRARLILHSFWAAVGSFEKGPVFGMPQVVSQVNLGEGEDFMKSELYLQNIAPFYSDSESDASFGYLTRSKTFALASHPLLQAVRDLPKLPRALRRNVSPQPSGAKFDAGVEREARIWLRKRLGGGDSNQLSVPQLRKWLERSGSSDQEVVNLEEELKSKHPLAYDTLRRLREASGAA